MRSFRSGEVCVAYKRGTDRGGWRASTRTFRVAWALIVASLVAPAAFAQTITGAVFQDPDASGTRAATEIGVPGIVVSAYDTAGTLSAQTASCGLQAVSIAADPPAIPSAINVAACPVAQVGNYNLTGLTTAAGYRLELSWSDDMLFDAAQGADAGTTVQFATAGAAGVDFGVSYPEDYCQDNPRLIASCYIFNPVTGTIPPYTPGDASQMVVSWPYDQRATAVSGGGEIHPHDDDADYGDLGHILGVAIHRETRSAIFSAIASPLWPAGGAGIGGVYTADYTGASNTFVPGSVATLVDLNGPDDVSPADDLIDLRAQDPVSVGVLDRFGEQGIGGIDLSDDDQTLWLINMGAGTLARIDVGDLSSSPTAGDISELPIPDPGCANGVFRPGALTVRRGSVFIGGICDASTSAGVGTADLSAEVIEYDGVTFTPRFSFPLDFQMGKIFQAVPASFPMVKWQATDDQFQPQPFMTNLAFDDDDSLVLGFMPRLSYHGLVQVAGFMVRAQTNGLGGYALESAGASGPYTSNARTAFDGVNTFGHGGNPVPGEGPGGTWFYENGLFHNFATMFHAVLFSAGLTIVPGSGEVAAGFTDPLGVDAFGVRYLDRDDGRTVAGVQFGGLKVALVSDVDVLCEAAPIEIGNRVWCDAPGGGPANGIQDPPGAAGSVDTNLPGVVVQLSCNGGTVTGTAMTDGNGNYQFNSANVVGGIPPGATCTVSIDTAANAAALGACILPAPVDAGAPTDPGQDGRDSDGVDPDTDGVIEAMVVIGNRGSNDHEIDFGFRAPPVPVLMATKTDVVVVDGDMDGMLDGGDTLRYTVVIANSGNADATGVAYASAVDANTALVVGSVTTSQGTVTTGNTGGDTATAVDIGTIAAAGGTVTITYDVTLNNPVPIGVVSIACQGTVSADNHSDVPTDDPDVPSSGPVPTPTPVDASPDVSATKVDAILVDVDMDGRADAGDTLKYTVVVTNSGDQDGTAVVYASSVGANTTLVVGSVMTSQGTVTTGNGGGDTSVAIDIGTLAGAGGTVTIMYEVLVDTPIPAGVTQVSCQGTVTGGNVPSTLTDDPDDPTTDDSTDTPLDLGSDFGDAPDSYTTTASPSHTLDAAVGLYLGACIDAESAGQPAVAGDPADGDDLNDLGAPAAVLGTCAGNDDEDGVTFDTMVVACATDNGVTVSSSVAGLLDAWIDFDGDGAFTGSGEQVLTSQAVTAGANALTFAAPCSAESGMTYARFRVSTAGGLSFDGAAANGEVEDYQVTTKGLDLGDAPDTYGTTDPATAASHAVDPDSPLYLGACVDTEAAGQPNASADGDDANAGGSTVGTCAGNDDEDGVTFDTMIVACATDNEVTVMSVGAGALLDAWIDFDGDGSFTGAGEQIFTSQALTGGDTLAFAAPCTAGSGVTYARFRMSTAGGLASDGPAMNGEVEDYRVTVKGLDFGDAPDSFTTTASPSHVVDPGTPLYLGACVDTEVAGQPSVGADGDDLGAGVSTVGTCTGTSDEDGVTFDAAVVACGMADVTVTASQAGGLLNAWLDFDGNGTFEAADQIFTDQSLAAGANTLTFAVPCDRPSDADAYARFRVSTVAGLSFDGQAMDGEVEDYVIATNGLDFGDAPETYGTTDPTTGASHVVDPGAPLYLGNCVDTEAAGQPVTAGMPATGDDLGAGISDLGGCAGPDDEDGVVFDSMLVACGTTDVTVTSSLMGQLDGWIDYDGDGTFAVAEQVFASQMVTPGANALQIDVPCATPTQAVTYARFRLSASGGLGPVGQATNGEIEDYDVATKGLDLGDAPDTYGTTDPATAASHVVDPDSVVFLGGCVDTEVAGQPNAGANGDDIAAGISDLGACVDPDDEDGVSFGSMIVACASDNEVTVTSVGAGALLDAWIDFDGDGTFSGASEQIFASQALTGGDTLTFAAPCTASSGETYARFRVSTAGGLSSAGQAMNGEVEDYPVAVKGLDFGDAPDTFTTTASPSHVVDPGTPLYLGACVDTEVAGQPSAGADGDDLSAGVSTVGTCTGTSDEDGVTFDTAVVACGMADVTVIASQAGGLLDAWLDFDGNGTFEAADQIFANQALGAGANTLTFAVPCDRPSDADSYARFRVSTAGGLSFDGQAMDGEVEDYVIATNGLDFGDAPETYGTTDPTTGASHVVDPGAPLFLGACVDTEAAGQPVTAGMPATGDDLGAGISDLGGCAGPDDEDGVVFDSMLVACGTTNVTVTSSLMGQLDGWIDFDGDGTFAAAEQVFASELVTPGANALELAVPCATPTQAVTYARFRLSSSGGLGPIGQATSGEVEDYDVTTKGLDFGDAPDTYATTVGTGGARHAVDPSTPLFLGACVDTELDGQPVSLGDPANGDDNGAGLSDLGGCTGPDDEDGVTFDSMIVACSDADITVTASQTGLLDAWIDFDGDGAFAGTEQVFASQSVASGGNSLTFAVPCATPTQVVTYARFRVSSVGGLGFGGPAMNGEVEDYAITTKGLDFGDAPNPYPTMLTDDGARHVVQPTGNPTLGTPADTEPDGQPDNAHAGDDQNGTPDDEDGVTFSGLFVPGGTAVDVTVTAGATGGLVDLWFDWNRDGDWSDPGEQVATSLPLGAGASTVLSIATPAGAVEGASCARARISSAGGLAPDGPAMDGEIEDYPVGIGVEDPAIGIAKELVGIAFVGDGEYAVDFLVTVDNAGNVDLSNVQVDASLATAFADAEGYSVSLLSSADFTVNPAYDGDGDVLMLTGVDGLAIGDMGVIVLQVIVRPGQNPGPYFCSSTARGDSPGGTPVDDDSQDGSNSDPDADGDPTDNDEPTVVIVTLAPTDIPTLGEWSLMLLSMLLALAGLRAVRRI